MFDNLKEVIRKVEQDRRYYFKNEEVFEIFFGALEKCRMSKKDREYFPLLFQTELEDYVMRKEINVIGGAGYVRTAP